MKNKRKLWLGLLIVLTVVFTSFGYAALNTELSLSGEGYVRVDEDIRVTGLKLTSISSGGYETYNSKYSKDATSIFVTLPPNGTATYEVEVTNKGGEDYFLMNITNNPNYELLDSKVYDVFSGNSKKKIHLKIKNTKGTTENIALNLEYEFQKDEKPTITLADLPKWNTKGDDYIVKPEYTTINGATAKCKSNLEPTIENITDLKNLTKTGTHNITCTVTTKTGKSASVTKNTKITYDPYNTNNIVKNGSFENGTSSWDRLTNASISSKYSLDGNYSLFLDNPSNGVHNYSAQTTTIKPILNHKYYGKAYYLSEYSFPLYTRFEWFHNDDTYGKGLMNFSKIFNVNNTWQYNSNIMAITDNTYLNDNWVIRNFGIVTAEYGYYPIYTDSIIMVDLTATFGAGNEPNKEWCDKHIKYFDGTTIIYK